MPDEVRVSALLPDEAKQPVSENMLEMIARGDMRPTLAMAQSMAIEIKKARAATHG